jgi:long-chain acyl-CoA synthetase
MLDEIESTLSVFAYRDGLKYQFIAQLFHTAIIGAYMSLCTGMTLILMSQFSVQPYLESLVREKVNMISVVPTVLKWLLDEMDKRTYDLSALRVINYSTCPIPPSLLERAIRKMNCDYYQSYGMTEMASVVTALVAEDHFADNGAHLGSVGRPIPGAQVKIVRQDGSQCDIGEVGEILVKGRGRMKEYLGQPELTEKSFVDGWYCTKDVGFLDKDGFLILSGRKAA